MNSRCNSLRPMPRSPDEIRQDKKHKSCMLCSLLCPGTPPMFPHTCRSSLFPRLPAPSLPRMPRTHLTPRRCNPPRCTPSMPLHSPCSIASLADKPSRRQGSNYLGTCQCHTRRTLFVLLVTETCPRRRGCMNLAPRLSSTSPQHMQCRCSRRRWRLYW